MGTVINAKGTSYPSFKIGKRGITLHQGEASNELEPITGDFWFDSSTGTLRYRKDNSWNNINFDNIILEGSAIKTLSGNAEIDMADNILFSTDVENDKTVYINNYEILTTAHLDNTSSAHLKTDVEVLNIDERFDQLNPVIYLRKSNNRKEIGFIAEEVNALYPEVIRLDAKKYPRYIDYGKMVAILTAKIQSQQTTIDQHEEKLTRLEQLYQILVEQHSPNSD